MGYKTRCFAIAMITLSVLPMSSFAVDSWQAGSAYPQGSETCYNEILYKARWWATCVQNVVKQDELLKSLPTIFEANNKKGSSSD